MMDPSMGWFQRENKGPALSLWLKLWKDFNKPSVDQSSDSTDDKYSDIVSKLCQRFPQLIEKEMGANPLLTHDLDSNQHLICKYNGIPWRKSKDTTYEGIDGLHQEIEDFYDYLKPKPNERNIRVAVQTRITHIIEQLWSDAVVECFGSFKTNTYLPTSDIDLVVVNHRWPYLPLSELEQHFIKTQQCHPAQIRVLYNAAVPIIKMIDIHTGIRINISFNMPQVVKSVNLVNEYLKEFPNATKLLFVVKQFVLQRDLNEVFKGGLSSYSLVLMVVHFFKTNPDTQTDPKSDNLGKLLMRFLELYGRNINYDIVGLKVKDGIFAKKSEMLAHMENGHDSRHAPSLLCIEDPLDDKNNVSKNSYNVPKIRDSFKYAFEVLDIAVGPNQKVVGKCETILGRIIRITDQVVDQRQALNAYFGLSANHFYAPYYPNPYNPYKMVRNNNNNRNNRGNRGNRRWNNKRFVNNWNNQNRTYHQNLSNSNQSLNCEAPVADNVFHSNGVNNTNRYYPKNEFRRNNGQNNGVNNGHNHNKYSQYNGARYKPIAYYSFDRNTNQHRERAQQHEEQISKDLTKDVKNSKLTDSEDKQP